MLNRDRAHALLESPIHLIRNRDASKFWMANATGQVSNMSVLREETTTSSQREISTNGGGLDSPAEVTSLIAGNSFCLTPGNNGGIGLQKKATTGAGLNSTQRATDATKRKKLRSRNVPPSPLAQKTEAAATSLNQTNIGEAKRTELNYSEDHLDAWLENCLRDATNAQLSSSSEFLDFIPPTAPAHKQMFLTQQQQLPQLKQQLQQQRQQEFSKRTQPYGVGPGTPFSLGIQRNSSSLSHRYPMLFPPQSLSSYGMSFGGDGGQEFASLPPLNNMMGGPEGLGCEHEPNSTDVLDGSGSNPNFSKGFRFSDPCLLNPSDNDSKLSGQNTPECRNVNNNGSGCDLAHQNKFFAALMEQINILHDTNSKICRNLHDTKVDIEALKHAPNSQPWAGAGFGGMRHRRDSLSGLSTQSQPLILGSGLGGTHSPAPTFHSGAYTPGMMTDVVREVKEAARIREDALLSRVKLMVEERQCFLNEGNVRILRDIDDLKTQVMQLRLEKKETNKRLSHLESENKCLRQALAGCYNNQRPISNDIIYENDRSHGFRKPFPNGAGGGVVGSSALGIRRAKSLNLHYGTMHQTPIQTTHSLEEDDEIEEEQLEEQVGLDGGELSLTGNNSLSCSSIGLQTPSNLTLHSQIPKSEQQAVRSPPSFALISDQINPGIPPPLLPRKKDHAHLKRELSEAASVRKETNQRIIALEKLVEDLSDQVSGKTKRSPTVSGTASDIALASKFSVADAPITDL
ncbi:uncharacterized protein LOC117145959 isoform X5 [Drosophila mauritiana]|uniref:Uncharacterized protein LOC117145959 isoform X5 n=1 Tax=Drosophila mauritiana TaxID=7226 RepID=A0A6P8KEV1_DROMA|nr:uncharacterized protein LOC117145959 isoform X5 [Drosophila mauritiana]